jgi:hypothetical protein
VPRDPFEHMYVTAVFQPAFYQCLMGHKLSGTERLSGLTKLTGGSSKRYTIPILREHGGPPADRAEELGIYKCAPASLAADREPRRCCGNRHNESSVRRWRCVHLVQAHQVHTS